MSQLNENPEKNKGATRTPALRVLNALSWMVQENSIEVGVREMAHGLGLSPSTAHRLLSELVKADFVKYNDVTSRYSLSLEFIRLAHKAVAQVSLEQVAISHMRRLTNACNETSLLGVYDRMRQEMMFMAIVEPSHPLRYSIELNKWLPLHVGGSGLAIMAYLKESEISSIIERTRLVPVTSRSITERYKLEAEIQNIRKRGYAITKGQRIPDAVGLGAPIFGSNGEVVGDICLTIPESRFEESAEQGIAELLKECATAVTFAIGGKVQAS